MESPQLKRRKILLLFLLGVGVPSLALGYLAFRGIRNELALREQRRLDEHRTVSRFVSDTLSAEFAQTERAVARAVATAAPADSTVLIDALRTVRRERPIVEAVFYVASDGSMRFPASELLYQPDGSLVSRPARSWLAVAAAHFQRARQEESQRRQYSAALLSYRQAFAAVSDPALKGEALLGVARVQRRAGHVRAAVASLETLEHDYGQVRTTSGLPLGPIAHLVHGSLLLASGDSLGALRSFFDLYEGLVEREWTLEHAQYDFYATHAADSIARQRTRLTSHDSVPVFNQRLADLRVREEERRRATDRLLMLQEAAGEDLRDRAAAGAEHSAANGHRFALANGGQSFLVSLLGETRDPDGTWGVLYDADALGGFLRATLDEHLDPATADWVVNGRDGQTLLRRGEPPEGPLTINATLADNFPPWLIEFHQQPENPYLRLFASSQSLYLYMFLLIAGILGFGLVLTVRAVSHELDLARLKSDFVSTVSHEFKSPLTSIRHLAEMLQAGSVPSDERRQRYYDVLVEQSARLSTLVANILDLARIEEGKKEFTFQAIDPGELVRDLVTATQHRVGHDGYVVEAHIEDAVPAVRADRAALSQAISNLLDNAIQYSGDAEEVTVSVSARDGRVTIAVQDRGVGIPASEIDRVFERFYRGGDPHTRAVKGSGLGLTLVKGGAVGFTGCKDGMIDWASFVVAGAALKTVVIFSVWTLKRPGCLRWLSTLRPGSRWPPLWAYSVPNR